MPGRCPTWRRCTPGLPPTAVPSGAGTWKHSEIMTLRNYTPATSAGTPALSRAGAPPASRCWQKWRPFRTFKDSASKNHAHLSTQVMRQNSLLDFLPEAERECVEMAVRLHNQFKVPDGLSQYTETLLKLLRDADKLDIWRVFIEYFDLPEAERASAAGLDFPDLPSCSKEVLATIGAGEMVQLSTLKSLNDFKLLQLSWVYDINSRSALELVRERAVLDRFAAILPKDAAVVDVLARVREYLDGRLDNGAGEDFPFGSWQETEDSSE